MYRKEKGGVLVLAQKFGDEVVKVTRDEVDGYVNDSEFQYFLSVYQYVELWGLPNGSAGWANESSYIMDGITALKVEAKTIEAESYDKSSGNGATLGARSAVI